MRFLSVKSEEPQAVLMMHRARSLVVSNHTAQVNQIRGLLGEFGLIVPVGIKRLRKQCVFTSRCGARSVGSVTTFGVSKR